MRQFLLGLAIAVVAAAGALAQPAGYRIQPGDTLQVTVLEDESLNRTLLVAPDGRISVPLAGTIAVAGSTVDAVENTIADRLASNFAVRPNVFVLGEVNQPGLRQIEPGTTLLQALALAGGPSRFAATKRIQLRRMDTSTGRERLYLFNYRAVERGGSIQSMIALREGDVVIVPERRLFE